MHTIIWGGFFAIIFVLLALDLGILNRRPHVVGVQESLRWTAFWIGISLLFNVGVYFLYDRGLMQSPEGLPQLSGLDAAIQFFTAYVVEKMLSLDNIFVIAAVMTSFRVPAASQHRVLFWGIFGALVLRGAMIFAGTAAIRQFSWLMIPLGLLLVYTGAKMFRVADNEDENFEENLAVRVIRRYVPVTRDFEGARFSVRPTPGGRLHITPLLLALVAIEFTDVIFALDSVPAVFGVTLDPFLVMTSNIFAILGLRALFFALRAMLDQFRYLKPTVALILVFVGGKMIAGEVFHVHLPPLASLALIGGLLTMGIVLSLLLRSETSPELSPESEVEQAREKSGGNLDIED
jgi:tellurite resistance protein TerC